MPVSGRDVSLGLDSESMAPYLCRSEDVTAPFIGSFKCVSHALVESLPQAANAVTARFLPA